MIFDRIVYVNVIPMMFVGFAIVCLPFSVPFFLDLKDYLLFTRVLN